MIRQTRNDRDTLPAFRRCQSGLGNTLHLSRVHSYGLYQFDNYFRPSALAHFQIDSIHHDLSVDIPK